MTDAQPPFGPCPCGRGLAYPECCGRWHARHAADGTLAAPTAEDLMRSRYTAFARIGAAGPVDQDRHDDAARTVAAMVAYLRATWAPEMRPAAADLTPGPGEAPTVFTRLAVTDATGGGPFDTAGTVSFTALGRDASGGRVRLTERSRFRREGGFWRYVDGDVAG